jgi:glycosyltransferase involved in cell wall biosynthesis
MPSLNQGAFLEEAINSVLDQGPNVELIVIDGGSTDKSVAIIKKYADRLGYWVSEKDRGQSDAINKGILKASGEIITWLNSDDLYEDRALKTVREYFSAHPHLELLHGRAVLFGEGKTRVVGPKTTLQRWEYLPYMRFPQPSAFFRKSLLDHLLPINEKLNYAMDHELVAKAILMGAQVQGIENKLSRYRLHPESKSMNEEPFMREWTIVFANTLSSVKEGEEFLKSLKRLRLAGDGITDPYPVKIKLSHAEVQKAFLEYLHLRLHGFYRLSDKKRILEILDEIKQIDPEFAEKNQYDNYVQRLRYIPKFIYRLYRTIRK